MNILAVYAINQHLADLQFEADQARLARQVSRKPSALRRAVASIRSAIAGRSSDPTLVAASAA
jgi:hypothetical protein